MIWRFLPSNPLEHIFIYQSVYIIIIIAAIDLFSWLLSLFFCEILFNLWRMLYTVGLSHCLLKFLLDIVSSCSLSYTKRYNSVKVRVHFLADVTSRFDRVFWFGDFNFRVNKKRSETDELFARRDFSDQEQRKNFIIEVVLLVKITQPQLSSYIFIRSSHICILSSLFRGSLVLIYRKCSWFLAFLKHAK